MPAALEPETAELEAAPPVVIETETAPSEQQRPAEEITPLTEDDFASSKAETEAKSGPPARAEKDDSASKPSAVPQSDEASSDPLPIENTSDAEPPPFGEELPPDFWDSEAVETINVEPASAPKRAEPTSPKKFDKDAPVLEQLQSLFPGRITRVDPFDTNEPDTSAELDDDAIQESLFD